MNSSIITNKVENIKTVSPLNKTVLKAKNEEHIISKNSVITSRIARNGIIKFCNTDFISSFGITKKDDFKDSRHPEMPNIILKIIEYNIEHQINSTFFIKNKNANGKYFWTISNFDPNKSDDLNIAFTLTSRKATAESVYQISKLYHRLNGIEESSGEEYALKYLRGFLEDRKISFSQFNQLLTKV